MAVGSGRPINRQARAEPEQQNQAEFGFARGPIASAGRVYPRRGRRRAGPRQPAPLARGADHACLFTLVSALHDDGARHWPARRSEAFEWNRVRCLAAVAHDVRGALANIAGLAEILGDEPPERSRQLASRIVTLAHDVSSMMSELIEAGRPERPDVELDSVQVSARALLAECAADAEAQCQRKGLRFHAALPPDEVIVVDRIKLARVIQNLLSNAVRYTATGAVTLAASLTPATLRIIVRDTGIGIAAGELGSVFRPYERLEAAAAMAPDGAGLGLASASRLCALLGAEIQAESTPGVGSTFVVTVPREPMTSEPASSRLQPLPVSA